MIRPIVYRGLSASAFMALLVLAVAPPRTAAQEGGSPETVLQGIDPGLGISSLLDAGASEDASTAAFTGLASKINVDPQFGSATSSIPIALPSGRKEMTPDLTVRYSSNLGNGILGVGWDLELGCIKRSTSRGVPFDYANGSTAYSDGFGFTMSFRGGTIELDTPIGASGGCSNAWAASSEEVWLSACFNTAGNQWTVRDTRGMTYTYGAAQGPSGDQARSGRDVSAASGTFGWHLTRIEDLSGNAISIEYWKDGGHVYPKLVHYGGNAGAGLDDIFHAEIETEERDDVQHSRRGGFADTIARRVVRIKVWTDGYDGYDSDLAPTRTYHFAYQPDPDTSLSLLSSVSLTLADATTAPPPTTTFEYTQSGRGFGATAQTVSSLPGSLSFVGLGQQAVALIDLTGDGILDHLGAVSNGLRLHEGRIATGGAGETVEFTGAARPGRPVRAVDHGDGSAARAVRFIHRWRLARAVRGHGRRRAPRFREYPASG